MARCQKLQESQKICLVLTDGITLLKSVVVVTSWAGACLTLLLLLQTRCLLMNL